MFSASYRVATVAGIPINVHVSLVLMVLVIALNLGSLTAGIVLGAGLAVSIVLHELGHSLVALRMGCRVRQITLMCIGGAAQMEELPTRPRDEFLMAVAGPAVSLLLGAGGIGAGILLSGLPPFASTGLNLLMLLGALNIGLLLFNLLPSFPMDGGRVLRAVLTPRLGRLRATFVASRIGRVMAVLFGIYGFSHEHWFLVFIAFFVFIVAGKEYEMVKWQEAARRGYGVRPGFEPVYREGDASGQAVISPPPYERRRRGVRADVYTEEDGG